MTHPRRRANICVSPGKRRTPGAGARKHLDNRRQKRVPPGQSATQCTSGMKTVLRGAGFRQWELPERPHWGKRPGIPGVSALRNPRERATECRKAENAVPCRRNADQSAVSVAGQLTPSRKEGITRNAAGRCPQESAYREQVMPFPGRLTSRFPVKPRKERIRQKADPSSGKWNRSSPCTAEFVNHHKHCRKNRER